MRLLLVEDEKRMAQALCEILRREKYDVDHFADGGEGLCALESGVYDLAVFDVMLPVKDGFEIVAEARKNGIKTPVLMLTAKSDLEDKVTGLDCGADDYLTKPFMTKELLARLRALARRNVNISFSLILTSPCFHPHTLCRAHSLWHPRRPPDKPFSSARRTPAFCDRPFRSQ